MNNYKSIAVIPINLIISVIVGLIVAFASNDFEREVPSILLFSCAVALFFQEVFLVQIAHRKENIDFQNRLFSGKVTNSKRLLVLTLPFVISVCLGLVLMFVYHGGLKISLIMRILAVGIIITLGIDPIIGLFDKGPVAMFGAIVIYGIVVNSGLNNYPELGDSLGDWLPLFPAVALSSMALAYLLLSIRWTYYRLFCLEYPDWKAFFIRTGIPLAVILSPSYYEIYESLRFLFLGV